MVKKAFVLLALVGCSSTSGEPRSIPSDAVLCQIFAGNGIEKASMMGVPGFGSLSTDVIAAWGEPTDRKGDVWAYSWSGTVATLTFKQRDLCYSGGKHISGLWLLTITSTGDEPSCWNYERREKNEPTCDGCLNKGEVALCL